MTKILFKARFIFFLLLPLFSCAQTNGPYAGEIRKVGLMLDAAHNMAYDYSFLAEYPNGETDKVKGVIYINETADIMYNDNDAFSMVYTDKWYYKADHRNKTVTIVNLAKHLNKDYKEGIQHDIFSKGTEHKYFDSVILKYGEVKNLKKSNDSVQMELLFPQNSPIRTVGIAYDDKQKIMVGYRIQTYTPWKTNEFGKNKGTRQTIDCTNYRMITDNKSYTTDNFFTVKKSQVVLKKYKSYKVITRI